MGQGGNCDSKYGENYTTYGRYDMMPKINKPDHLKDHENQLGSMGVAGDAETSGGGRIVIIAEAIALQGFGVPIQANAKPFETVSNPYYEQGGSGGYIFIHTTN